MKITIEPTEQFFMAGDVMVRMWGGTATLDDGTRTPVAALVTAVAFTGQSEAMAEGLVSIPPPDAEAAKRWAERIMSGGGYEDDESRNNQLA